MFVGRMMLLMPALLIGVALAVEPSLVLPDDPMEVADHTKPIKVFLMLGQSNMLGVGKIRDPERPQGTLESLKDRYPHLVNDTTGEWTVRQDVVSVLKNSVGSNVSSFLQVGQGMGYGSTSANYVGPELQFGHVLGHVFEEPVLLLKVATGNRALGWDFCPPGTLPYEYDDTMYAGYGQCPENWDPDAFRRVGAWMCDMEHRRGVQIPNVWYSHCHECVDERWYAGKQYDLDKENAQHVLNNLADYFPGYLGQGFEIAGYAFWQGQKDTLHDAYAKKYKENLVQYIRALRQEYQIYPGGANAPFVLATIAFGWCNMTAWENNNLNVFNAQMAVNNSENVKTVDARTFWRDATDSPCNDGSHYNCNAETYMEVGNALGWAMADLIQNKSRLEEHVCPLL